MMEDRISRMIKIRRDLERRIDFVLLGICSQRFSGFKDFLASILQQSAHRISICSALGLPVGKTDYLLSLLTSDSPSSTTMIGILGRRTYYFLRVLEEVLNNPLTPDRWPVFAPALESNMQLSRPFLPTHESKWSIIKSDLLSYGEKTDLSRYSQTTWDSKQWPILQCISMNPDVPMDGKDYLLIANTLGYYIKEHNFLDPATKWWAFERYFWSVQRLANSNLSQKHDDYRLLCTRLQEFLESSDSSSELNPELAKTEITPELYRRERTLLFAAINAMKILANPFVMTDCLPKSVERKLKCFVLKAEEEILPMVDYGHLWWMCQKLILLYNLIRFEALTETREFLKCDELKLQEYEIGKHVYSSFSKKMITTISDNVKSKLENPSVKNWQISVVILGPSGVGKSSIVESICFSLKDYVLTDRGAIQEKDLQSLATTDQLNRFLDKTKELFEKKHGQKRVPVFIDEFHSTMAYNQFTAILPFLTRENHALPIFATSECNTRDEFLQNAACGQITHKIDFSTRIQNWLELPGLEYSATQRLLIYLKHNMGNRTSWTCAKQNLAQVALDSKRWKTARDIRQLDAKELGEVVAKINGSADFKNQEAKDHLLLFNGTLSVS